MKRTDSQVAAYPIVAREVTTLSAYPAYDVVNDKPSAYTTPADGINPLVLGQHVVDRDGKSYVYVRAGAALAGGQVTTLLANISEGAIQTADSTGDNIHVLKTNFAGLTANSEVGNFIHIGNSTGSIGIVKKIKANTATVSSVAYITISKITTLQGRPVYDGDAMAAALATSGSELSLIRPYYVDVCGADGTAMGISQGVVTSGNNTLVQIEGLAEVLGVGATSFTDGARTYAAAAGEIDLAGDEEAFVGLSKSAYAGANSVKVPVWLMGLSCKW